MYCLAKNRQILSMLMMVIAVILLTAILPLSGALAVIEEPPVSPPDELGPYKVGWHLTRYIDSEYGGYNAIIYYPAQRDGWRAKKDTSDGPYPGIVVANGYFGSAWNITWIPRHLASHGYVTLVFTPPTGGTLNTFTPEGFLQSFDQTQWAAGLNGGIDELIKQNTNWFSPMRDLLDTSTFGVIGLSMGGAGVIEAAANNDKIDAAVGLASAYIKSGDFGDIPMDEDMLEDTMADLLTAVRKVKVPIQLQVGTDDGFVKPANVYELYGMVPTEQKKEYIVINGASHVGYLDLWVCPIGDLIERVLGGQNVCGFEEQHQVSSRYFTSWFQYYLKDIKGYKTYICGSEAEKDRTNQILTELEYN